MDPNKQVPVTPAQAIRQAEAATEAAARQAEHEAAAAEAGKNDYEQNAKHGEDIINELQAQIDNPTPFVSTGFNVLDVVLGDGDESGGLPPGLITLGAIPSLGKSTLALQIADNIANSGRDVLIIALEMTVYELAARSVSRLTAELAAHPGNSPQDYKNALAPADRTPGLALTARGVRLFKSRRKRDEEKSPNAAVMNHWREAEEILNRSIKAYSEIAPHLYIYVPRTQVKPERIVNITKAHIDRARKENPTAPPPIILVDYMQIMAPSDVHQSEKANMDTATLMLKHLARDYNTSVIAISSFNRMNYKEVVSMEAFKESGGIEYSSDIAIAMQLYGTGMAGKNETLDIEFEKTRNPRRIQAKILKNRDGRTGQYINLEYYAPFNLFVEAQDKPSLFFTDVPEHWKAEPPKMKADEARGKEPRAQEPAVDISGLMPGNQAKEKKKTKPGKV